MPPVQGWKALPSPVRPGSEQGDSPWCAYTRCSTESSRSGRCDDSDMRVVRSAKERRSTGRLSQTPRSESSQRPLDSPRVPSTHLDVPSTHLDFSPRGILTHHYKTDKNGLVTEANLIVGITNNHAPISLAIKRAAQKLITPGKEVGQGLLNMVEMAFRLFDPCFSCASHTLPGQMPLVVDVFDAQGQLVHSEGR
jgi:hypothetical protein